MSNPGNAIWDGGLADAQLPDHINVDICASSSRDADADPTTGCFSCCTNNGFRLGAVIEGRCLCDTFPRDPTVCAQAAASGDTCLACCQTASYEGAEFSDDSAGRSCSCTGLTDPVSCESTATAPNPYPTCQLCCLEKGFIEVMFFELPAPVCTCLSR